MGDKRSPSTAATVGPVPHALRMPVELVRMILEFAARESPTSAANFVCVSKTVQEWIAPLLYHTAILQSSNSVSSFYGTIQIARSSFASHVTELYLPPAPSPRVPLSFLANFPALQHLAISSDSLQSPVWPSLLRPNSPRLTSITIMGHLGQISFEHPIFRVVTHLYFADDVPAPFTLTSQMLPRLTHLSCAYRHGFSSSIAVTCLPLLLSKKASGHTGAHSHPDRGTQAPLHMPARPTSPVELEVLIVELFLSNGTPDETMLVMERLGLGKKVSESHLRGDPRLVFRPGKVLTPRLWENLVINNVLWNSAEREIKIQRSNISTP